MVSKEHCPCTYDCPRIGDCEACISFHRKVGSLVACMAKLKGDQAPSPEAGRVLTLEDKPHLTDYAACAG